MPAICLDIHVSQQNGSRFSGFSTGMTEERDFLEYSLPVPFCPVSEERQFRDMVAAKPGVEWSPLNQDLIDPTLGGAYWMLDFLRGNHG